MMTLYCIARYRASHQWRGSTHIIDAQPGAMLRLDDGLARLVLADGPDCFSLERPAATVYQTRPATAAAPDNAMSTRDHAGLVPGAPEPHAAEGEQAGEVDAGQPVDAGAEPAGEAAGDEPDAAEAEPADPFPGKNKEWLREELKRLGIEAPARASRAQLLALFPQAE